MATTGTKIGIWMDYSIAHLMEYSNNPFEIQTIESNFTQQEQRSVLQKGELHLHHKEQDEQSKYYKKLIDVVKKYKEVILFGPTNAKQELFNILATDKQFDNTKIRVKNTDKMTPNQQHAFINDFYSNS